VQDWVVYDLVTWAIVQAQYGETLTPHHLSMKFLANCKEMVNVYYETIPDYYVEQ